MIWFEKKSRPWGFPIHLHGAREIGAQGTFGK
jgi:hypothetical protein